jgi:hypothetical protein
MRLSRNAFSLLNFLAAIFLALVTVSIGALGQSSPPPPPTTDWVPQEIASLGQYASSRTEFTLDHSMLVLASKADQDDYDLRRVIAGGPGATDLWVHMEHNTVSNIAVLFAGENRLNFISVSGSISPIDLLHLAGHFGIPKVEGGVPVLAPDEDR